MLPLAISREAIEIDWLLVLTCAMDRSMCLSASISLRAVVSLTWALAVAAAKSTRPSAVSSFWATPASCSLAAASSWARTDSTISSPACTTT